MTAARRLRLDERRLQHDSRRRVLRDAAAQLFATRGYHDAPIMLAGRALGGSRDVVKRYFLNKEELLFTVVDDHLAALQAAVEAADPNPDPDPNGNPARPAAAGALRLERLALAYLDHVAGPGANGHRVLLEYERRLQPAYQADLRTRQRWIAALFADALAAALPRLRGRPELRMPLTLSLFALLNGQLGWFRAGAALERADYARLAVSCTLEGGRKALLTPPPRPEPPSPA